MLRFFTLQFWLVRVGVANPLLFISFLASSFSISFVFPKRHLDRLIDFDLTVDEVKDWLENEPNFIPSDDSYHGKKSDDKSPEP